MASVFVLPLMLFPLITAQPEQAEPVIDVNTMSIIEQIDYINKDDTELSRLIKSVDKCESGHAIKSHDGGLGVGSIGLHRDTFNRWLSEYQNDTNETLNYESNFDQLKMASWAFSKGESYRDDWTTYVAIRNGGVYKFYSKKLDRQFTVYCKLNY